MKFRLSLSLLAFCLCATQSRPAQASELDAAARGNPIRGRIEILNPQVKQKSGEADASGIVVWLDSVPPSPHPPVSARPRARLEQKDKRFSPHVLAVQVGAEVEFPNLDPFFHNVFSVFHGKAFDLGLYDNGETRRVRFNRSGTSYIFCNIHPQMSAVVVVVDTPYFTTTSAAGAFTISEVPEGEYELALWHERCDDKQLAAQRRRLQIGSIGADLGILRLDELGFVSNAHKNKYGEDYPDNRSLTGYRRP